MAFLGSIQVVPELPEEIKRLKDLASNLYYSWNPEARQLFRTIDKELWQDVNHNPVKFLREVQQKKLEKYANDAEYLALFKKVIVEFDQYMKPKETWFSKTFPEAKDKLIAYFSAEFGLHESLPIYSGGLGVLSGDHLKSCSDLGVPVIGISLFYHETYFTQQIDAQGRQTALYPILNPEELPLSPILDDKGNTLLIDIALGMQNVKARIWKAQVGRVDAYLLDTDIPENNRENRSITSRLYGGDQEMRITQEIVLGMGGVIALKALGLEPAAWHMNEGHSVFLALERIRSLVKDEKLQFHEALEAVKASTVFTTHTPVPAGNDAFPLHIKDKYFQRYWEEMGISRHEFIELGSQVQPEGYEIFNLTILSLKLSRFRNGVSKLHGEVSRRMWSSVWEDIPQEEIPICSITNGVHAMTWIVYKMRKLFDHYLGSEWRSRLDDVQFWKSIFEIPDEALWKAKLDVKEKMLNHLRERLAVQYRRNKVGVLQLGRLEGMLNPNVLTIGFARRFATYKRGNLILRDPERLKRILNNPDRPVQLVFAGKAHPNDHGGQGIIADLYQRSQQDGFRGKIFFIEGYDIHLGRDLTAGVDLWLNNPRRTREASGTSGQKVSLNGGINFSVLDGWWVEGYNGKNGWAFGDREDYQDLEELDSWDSDAIYDILENDIVPLYYDRDKDGVPHAWIQVMKNSLVSILPIHNTHRMVKEYVEHMYLQAVKNSQIFSENQFENAKELAQWIDRVENHWDRIRVKVDREIKNHSTIVLKYKEPFALRCEVNLGKLKPEEVKVQVYLVEVNGNFTREKRSNENRFELVEMTKKKSIDEKRHLYEASIVPSDSGNYEFTIRVLPYHRNQSDLVETGLVYWLNNAE
jgi:starch phosphorylase